MELSSNQTTPSFAIGDLVMAKYKRKPLLYKVIRIETVEQANIHLNRARRTSRFALGYRGNSGYPSGAPVYVLRSLLNKNGEIVKNPGYRRLSGHWLVPDRQGNRYAELLEEHISRLDAEAEKLKKVFIKHFEKRFKI